MKLIMSAFGPYKDKVEIDFSKLSDSGIFLIAGDTGSGKTTIFDALSFALFGEASGSRRDTSSFRSDFALDDVSTFVKFIFMHKGVLYEIERVPKYMRKKKRGDGLTAVGGDASLVYLDEVITGEKNVTDKCIEILGMNANQFKQIVMIAQGEFLELLLAKSKDRATIFRHIFDTGIYKDISDNLKNRYLLKKREYEDILLEIKGYIQSIQLNNDLIGNESILYVLDVLDKEIADDVILEKKLDNDRDNLLNESYKLTEIISSGKILNDGIVSLDKAKIKLDELFNDNDRIRELELVISRNKDIWDKIMPWYIDLNNLKNELRDKKKKLAITKEEHQNIIKDYELVVFKYNDINIILDKINECSKLIDGYEEKLSLFDEINELEKKLEELLVYFNYVQLVEKRELLSKCDDCYVLESELSILKNKINDLKNAYIEGNKNYNAHYDLFLSAQAGILASGLEDGVACPVCGSKEHPMIAKKVDDIFTKERLDEEKNVLECTYQELEKLRLELLEKEKKIELLKIELVNIDEKKLRAEILKLEDFCNNFEGSIYDVDVRNLEKQIQGLELSIDDKKNRLGDEGEKSELLDKIKDNKVIITKLNNEIEKIKKSYNSLLEKKIKNESLINVYSNDIVELEDNISTTNLEYVKCYQALGYDDESSYVANKIEKEDLAILEKEVKKYNDEIVGIKAKIDGLEKIIAGRECINLEEFETKLDVINTGINEINNSLKLVNNKISNNKKVYIKLKEVSEKIKKVEKELIIYKDLSDTANGTIVGKSKLEFEQYVQAGYFDSVLISANKRFGYMTDNRYQLFRRVESTKISDKLGLELEVMDYYTGKRRDIKSLSGGESFKAALSLALGMSDTIQEFSGGVVIDAMFIDEGFGSLDSDSLDQAMNAIMMLSNGDKMIGIISHVNELKARIDKKIVVKKGNTGSTVDLLI